MFTYTFPAVKGVQAKQTYFVSMVPLKLLQRLFVVESDDIEPEFRAQRKINQSRIPLIASYITANRKNYVFSALAASVDGGFSFRPYEPKGNIGVLEIEMTATILLNDGQHRKAAIEQALLEDPSLENETISVVFYHDRGLSQSQQMFTDFNKHAVITSRSLNTLYDIRDSLAILTRKIVKAIPFFNKYTELQKDNLGKYSGKLFTLNNMYRANRVLAKGFDLDEVTQDDFIDFWNEIVTNIIEWGELESGNLSKKSLREEFVVTQGTVLLAFGELGHHLMSHHRSDYASYLAKLKQIDWSRSNIMWRRAMMREGRIIKSRTSVQLTYMIIKQKIGLPLTATEKRKMSLMEKE